MVTEARATCHSDPSADFRSEPHDFRRESRNEIPCPVRNETVDREALVDKIKFGTDGWRGVIAVARFSVEFLHLRPLPFNEHDRAARGSADL